MTFWKDIVDEAYDIKFGFIITMFFGYAIYRLTCSKKPGEVSKRSEDSDSSDNEVEEYNGSDEETKMVLLIRTDLKMGKGKIAAQCAHAAVAAYKSAAKHPKLLRSWEHEGQRKITLKVDSEVALMELSRHAKAVGLLTNVIHDAGRTQIAAGSKTVCAIGPGPEKLVDKVTGHLKLY